MMDERPHPPAPRRDGRPRWPLLGLLLAAAGCDVLTSDPERHPSQVPLAEILQLGRTGGDAPLPADGQSADTLVARLPDRAFTRRVTFRTTAGTFRASLSREVSVTAEPADGGGGLLAKAVLVADTVPGTAAVSATVSEFTQYISVTFTQP